MWVNGIQDICNSLTQDSIDNNQITKADAKQELVELLKIPENQFCADCNAKGNRFYPIFHNKYFDRPRMGIL